MNSTEGDMCMGCLLTLFKLIDFSHHLHNSNILNHFTRFSREPSNRNILYSAQINTHDGPGRIMRVAFSRHRPEFLAATSYGALEVLRLEFNKRVARRKEEEEEEDFEPVDENFGLKTDRDEGGDRRGGGKGRREERGRGGKKDNDSGYSGGEEEDRRDRRSDR